MKREHKKATRTSHQQTAARKEASTAEGQGQQHRPCAGAPYGTQHTTHDIASGRNTLIDGRPARPPAGLSPERRARVAAVLFVASHALSIVKRLPQSPVVSECAAGCHQIYTPQTQLPL